VLFNAIRALIPPPSEILLMHRVLSLLTVGALCAAFAFPSSASAESLSVISDQSVLTFSIDIGFLEVEGDPSSFVSLFSAIGQGGVPLAADDPDGIGLPGPVTPGFSNGLSAQAKGSVNVTDGGVTFSIDGAAISLLDSGSWQPGTNINPTPGDFTFDHIAIPADLGAFIAGHLLAPDEAPPDVVATALVDAIGLSLQTATVPLILGFFSDPASGFTLNSASIGVESNLGNFGSDITDPITQPVALSGTYDQLEKLLTLPVSGFFDQQIPTDLLTLTARIGVNGQIVAQAVPEPSSFALLGMGLAGLAAYGYRRRK
jgi:hypothetical protein